MVKIDIIC
jgi:hypothetical protein